MSAMSSRMWIPHSFDETGRGEDRGNAFTIDDNLMDNRLDTMVTL